MNYYGAKELVASFRTVRKNTIQVAEDFPEDQYGFTPAEGTRSIGRMGLPRFGGRVNAFGHIVSCRAGVSPVGAVGNGRSPFSTGLVDAFLASTGPAASTGAFGIA